VDGEEATERVLLISFTLWSQGIVQDLRNSDRRDRLVATLGELLFPMRRRAAALLAAERAGVLEYCAYTGALKVMRIVVDEMIPGQISCCEMTTALEISCRRGHLACVRWLMDKFPQPIDDVREDIHLAMISACISGQDAAVRWLDEKFALFAPSKFSLWHRTSALTVSCMHDHMGVPRWLLDKYPATVEDVTSCVKVFRFACGWGFLACAQWIADTFSVTADEARGYGNYAFKMSCGGGHLEVARWLADRFSFTAEDARAADNQTAPYNSCCNGRLATATGKGVIDRFRPDAADVRPNAAFRMSCTNGHLSVAQWLADRFSLTTDDARAEDNYALKESCREGELATARWLATRFSLTAADARAQDNYALRMSCAGGKLAVAQWLVHEFALTADDARASGNFALLAACVAGRVDVAQWLTARFSLTAEDARVYNNRALRGSIYYSHFSTTRWLVDKTRPTPAEYGDIRRAPCLSAEEPTALVQQRWLAERLSTS
jgi:hypothetical protein